MLARAPDLAFSDDEVLVVIEIAEIDGVLGAQLVDGDAVFGGEQNKEKWRAR